MIRVRGFRNAFAAICRPSVFAQHMNATNTIVLPSQFSMHLTNQSSHQFLKSKHHFNQLAREFQATSTNCALVSFKLSDIGEGIKEVEVLEWFVNVGDEVSQFDNICEVQSDKAAVTITSRYDGIIRKLHHNLGDVAQVGGALVDIEVEGNDEEISTDEVQTDTTDVMVEEISLEQSSPGVTEKVLATPAVRKMAKEHNLDLADVKGSGENGRILKEDILQHVGQSEPSVHAPPQVFPPKIAQLTADRIEPIKGIRKVMFNSMKESLSIPHFGYDDEYDLSELVELRYKLKKEVKHTTGLKLSYMPFIIKATSLALQEYPILNSQIESGGNNIKYKADHNINVATDTPHGLLLPCIKQVQNLSILDIAAELNRLHEAGLKNKIAPADIVGGTFSLSNIGNIGGTYASPVIFPPQVAIGALGRIQALPRFNRDGDVRKAHIMCISWSGDHRIIEGATMARFSNLLKDYLEEPNKMLLHMK